MAAVKARFAWRLSFPKSALTCVAKAELWDKAMKKSEPREAVETVHKGRTFAGSYTLSSGMVHVISFYGRKSAQKGGMPPHLLAQQLFNEIIHEADAAGNLR